MGPRPAEFREPGRVRGCNSAGEGLKKAGKDLTREGPIEAIESLYDVDFGLGPQLRVDYSAKDHKGFDHVIPTVVRGGRALWRPS